MSAIRAGIVGLGVGEEHIAGYHAAPDCEVVAISDSSPEKLAEVGARHPDARVLRPDELLADPEIDVVSIASYDDAHFEQTMAAIESGKHVFVEKPLCTTEAEAEELRRALSEHPELKLSSNLPLRASPRFVGLRRMIVDGEFGELYYLEGDYDYGRLEKLTEGWRGDLDRYSVVLGGAVHLIDLLLWLTDRKPLSVAGAIGNRVATAGTKFRFDDLVVALIELEGGVVAKVGANFGCIHPHFHGVKVFGTEATFVNGLPDATLYARDGAGVRATTVEAPYPGVEKGALIPGFVDSIRGGGPAPVSAEEAFRTMAVCFAIERAHASGEAAEVRDPG